MQTRYPILFIPILLFALYFSYRINRAGGKSTKEQLKDFLDKEHEAKFIRSKPIEESAFLTPDITKLPLRDFINETHPLPADNAKLQKIQEKVIECAGMKMLSFKNADNLELKMKYGYGTFEDIVLYESNYEDYLTALSEWGHMLFNFGYEDDALTVINEAVDFGSDISKNFILLADLYKNKGDKSSLLLLKKRVIETGGVMTNKILTHIDNILQDMDDSEA